MGSTPLESARVVVATVVDENVLVRLFSEDVPIVLMRARVEGVRGGSVKAEREAEARRIR